MTMKSAIPVALFQLLAVWLCVAPVAAQTYTCKEVMIPMRDGVKLAADVYLPTQGKGPFPVIVERTPYNKNDCRYEAGDYFARRGYATIIEDERGRYNSEGDYYWWRDHAWGDHQDGYDTIEWAAKQPWSTGKVGTMGLSMGCHNQYMTAVAAPPHLAAMFCADAAGNPYKYLFYQGGALHMIMPTWLLTRNEIAGPFRLNYGRGASGYVGTPDTWLRWYQEKQKRGASMSLAMVGAMMTDMMKHPNYDDYWRQWAADEHLDRINVPVFHYAAWYDRYPLTQLLMFNGLREKGGPLARPNQKIQFGPWVHGAGQITNRVVGEVDFGPEAAIDYNALRLRWFDYHLNGIDNGIMKEPPVRIFVMGANVWRFENEFPLARTKYTDYYLRSGPSGSIDSLNDGLLSTQAPAEEKPDTFVYDPMKPVQTIGGDLFIEPVGARDHRPADRLSLTYTTPPLEQDTEITGVPKVDFDASSSAVDTDWVVTISDVRPDGYAQILRQNLLRARFREGFERPVLMSPGKIYHFTIEMFPISNVFKKDHRVRLTVTSSSFPKWFPNGNTGKESDQETTGVVANNTIYHDRQHPSRIVLPVIPVQATTAAARGAGAAQ